MPQYGYKFNRIAVDSTLHIPSYCGVPSITDYIKNGMIAIDTCNNVLFQWTRSSGWTPISTGTYLDTTNLSARINEKADSLRLSNDSVYIIKKVVTQAGTSFVTYYQYKNPYFKTSDTIILSNQIKLKLNLADTSSMLSKYMRRSDTGAMLKNYVDFGDTASIVNNYVRKSTTISATTPLTITGGGSLAANRTISIPKATNLVDGYLDDLDWIKFRNNLTNVRPQLPLYRTRFVDVDGYTDSVYIQMFQASPIQDGYLTLSGYDYFYNKVDTIYRDGDSIAYRVGNYYNAPYYDTYKIFAGGGGSGSGTVTSITSGYGLTSSVNPITTSGQIRVDSTTLKNRFLTKSDTINKFVNRLERVEGKDSIIFYIGATRYAIKDSSGTGSDTSKVVIAEVYNAEATTLNRGEVVYLYGSNGDRASVKRANNKGDSASAKTFGFVRENILAGSIGYVVTQGQIGKLNLGAYTAGQTIYLDSIAGQFTTTKPSAPYHLVTLGVIERANNGNGLLYVKPANGFELDELHNVQLNGTKNYSIFYYDSTNKLWKATDSIYAVQGKSLGIGTKNVEAKLDVVQGSKGVMPLKYEAASFQKNGEVKLGVYNSDTYASGTGSGIHLGNTKNRNSDNKYPSFELRNVNDSSNWANNYAQINYQERDSTGTYVSSTIDLFKVYADGTVTLNPYGFSHTPNPKLVIGNGSSTGDYKVETYGDVAFHNNVYASEGSLYTAGLKRLLTQISDAVTTNYSVAQTDHIIIASTDNDNITITLPEADDGNQEGRELIIKQKGDVSSYTLTIDGQGFYIDGSTPRDVAVGADGNSTIKIVCNGNEWFLLQGAFQ